MTPSVNRRSAAALFGLLAPMIVAPSLRVAAQEPLAPPVEEWVIERVTLDQAMGRALRASPQMAQALGAVDNAGSARRVAIGAFLPTLSLGTGAAFASADRLGAAVPGGTQTYSAGLSGSLDLFTGGRRIADLRRTGAQQRAADARLLEQRFQVVLVTKRAYFDALQADDVVRVAEAAVRRAEDGLVAAERRVRAGVAAPSDALRARLALTEARRLLAEGRSQQRVTAFALGRIVGADGAIGPEPIMDAAPRPLAIAESDLRALVLQEAPSVRAATADAGLAAAAASAARAAYLPSLRITGAYDWSAASASINAGAANWSVGIGLSYPLFDNFRREDATQRASVEADVARRRLDDATRAARGELERALAVLKLAEEEIALASEAGQVAREDLRVQQERYRVGTATILDLTTSQLGVAQAERALVTARYDFEVARAELEALAGRSL